jgi:hypothetical protein
MGERTDAKRSIESSARHMTEIAEELSRRASPRYIGEQAKEKALNKTNEWKEQMASSPTALSLIGGALGAAIGGALARNRRNSVARDSRYSGDLGYGRRSGYGYGTDLRYADDLRYREDLRYGEDVRYSDDRSVRAEAEGAAGAVREKIADTAQELKDRTSDVVAGMRERIPSAAELERKADENPMLVALGGIALGAIAAFLLPVTRKEREMLDPVKQRAGEAIGTLGNKIGDSVQQAQEKIAGQQEQSSQQSSQTGNYPTGSDSPQLPH